MPGGRITHIYPYGWPLPLVLVNIAMGIVGVMWLIFALGSWIRALGIIGLFLVLAFISSKLHQAYERTSHAVPIPREMAITKFGNGMPTPLLALRIAFFVAVAALVGFGIAPLTDATGKKGMIASALGLVVIGILNVTLERYYVHTGRGTDVPIDSPDSIATSRATNPH
jgi:hypothetical protein